MGLEAHLLRMFAEDLEFGAEPEEAQAPAPATGEVIWLEAAERELQRVPFFVRGKARRNTEAFAVTKGLSRIDVDTLYEAKAHYAR